MISFGVHCRVQIFQALRNHLVFCEPMASGSMVPHSFPGLLEDIWPGMPQWSTLVLHHTCRRQQSRQVLQPDINAKEISSCSAFPSVCSATMPLHSGVHFRMVVKPGTRSDFLENIFTPNIIFVFLRDH